MKTPDACETIELPEQFDTRRFLSRRSFVKLAATLTASAAAAAAAGGFSPTQAFAVTSAEKQAEADALKRKMDEWEVMLNQYSNDYYDAMDAYDLAVANMNAAQAEIDAALARQNELQEQLNTRARNMYKQGPLSFMDVVFGSASFVEFATTWDLLSSINDRDAVLIADCQAARDVAEQAYDNYAVQEQIANQKLAEAEEIYQDGLALQAAYQAELEALEEEIAALIEEERRAEEERRRREEEARRAAQQASSGGGYGPAGPSGYVPYNGEVFGSIVEAALSRLGCPYIWAASGPNSFDCSGLTSWSYRQVGIYIPRGGNAQYYNAPMRLAVADAQPGDILWNYTHVGLCIGGGQFIHAPRPGDVVRIANIAGYGWLGAARWW